MAAGEIASAVIAAGLFGAIMVAGWDVVRLLGPERRREEKELRKVRMTARITTDFEERLRRQQEARRAQQDHNER